ncbi:hypothetical protein GCM10010349_28770 [Streptomyces flavofungini]|nr:hypothetical protein GCM10010349_28770 [Streptomyces flavofungini]
MGASLGPGASVIGGAARRACWTWASVGAFCSGMRVPSLDRHRLTVKGIFVMARTFRKVCFTP